jgi:hypothetical protein
MEARRATKSRGLPSGLAFQGFDVARVPIQEAFPAKPYSKMNFHSPQQSAKHRVEIVPAVSGVIGFK